MAGELKHKAVGTELSQAEWEDIDTHVLDSAARGDLVYRGATGLVRLPAGTIGHPLKTGGAGADPSWGQLAAVGLATDAVETAKIKDLNVTSDKLSALAVIAGKIADGAVDTAARLADGVVTEGKIGFGAVTSGKIAAGAVGEAYIGGEAVTVTKIGPGAVTSDKLAAIPTCRAYHNANQSIANDTATVVALNSERFDTDNMHDLVTNNSMLICKTAGKYIASAVVQFAAHATGYRLVAIRLSGGNYIAMVSVNSIGAAGSTNLALTTPPYHLAVNDYLEVIAKQNSGGALNVEVAANYTPEFGMTRISS